nr:ribonuclease H-like domain-containing protein [Tanacetum cinerariifolium]
MKAQEDKGNMNVGWYITVKDVERLRQFLTPTIFTLPNPEPVVQPYMPLRPVYDKEKIIKGEEHNYDIPLHDGMTVAKKANCNPDNDVKELSDIKNMIVKPSFEITSPSEPINTQNWPPSGLKGLLHMLNATVIPTKENGSKIDTFVEDIFVGFKGLHKVTTAQGGSTTTTLTAKLLILNSGEYDLWLIRIEQYFLTTDYSLWEVIKNGNKVLKRTVGTVEQIYEPTSAEENLDKKNEIKARETLLMALSNKDQLKFHSYQDAKLLMEAIEKRYGGNKESKKPNAPQLAREDLEQIDPDDLEEIDLHWEMAMLTIRARRFIKRIGRNLDINGQNIGFDRGREYGRKTVPVENPTENALIAQEGIGGYDWSYQAKEEHPTNCALMALTSSRSSSSLDSESVEERLAHYKKNEVVFEEKINILNLEVKLRDKALVENTEKLEKAEKERDELKLTLEKFQNLSKSLNNLLKNYLSDKVKTGLGYKAASPAVESFVNSSETLENQENVKSRSDKGYHAVPPPYTRNYIPPKPDLMFIDEQVKSESVDVVFTVASSDVKTVELKYESVDVKNKGVFSTEETKPIRKNNFSPLIIEDWNSDDESEVEFKPKVEVKTVKPSIEKIKFVKTAREKVEKVETPKQNKHYPKGNQRNWNNIMSQRLGGNFKMINKACFIYGSFEHLHYVCDQRVVRPVWNNTRMLFPRVGSTTLNNKVIVTLSNLKCKLLQQVHLSDSAVGTFLH